MYKKNGAKVAGVGVNDADYVIVKRANGRQVWICPFYAAWRDMLNRAYKNRTDRPTYEDKHVCAEWLTFSNFKDWMELQQYQGMHLDKDIRVPGSKIYSPQTCAFVPVSLNSLLNLNHNVRGDEPVGVFYRSDRKTKPYQAYCNPFGGGKRIHVGFFETKEEAHREWQIEKSNQILKAVLWYEHQSFYNYSVAEALRGRVVRLIQQSLKGEETIEI